MKAKVIKTGKIVDVTLDKNAQPMSDTGAMYVYTSSDGTRYLNTELDFLNAYPDRQQIRIQASIAIMQGICSNSITLQNYDYFERAEFAVKQADALIEELFKG